MDRCALFVDAGYALADGAMAVHGTRRRDSVSWDHAGLLKLLAGLARDRTGLPVLRCYWYETAPEGRRTAEHDALAEMPGLKLRLVNALPGRREGIESQLRRDLVTLAKSGAISDAFIASANEHIAEIVAEAQDLGLRVVILHIASDSGWTIPLPLRQECDDIVEISGVHLRSYVDLIRGAEPAGPDEAYKSAPAAVGGAVTHHGLPAAALPAAALPASSAVYQVQEASDRRQDSLGYGGHGGSSLAEPRISAGYPAESSANGGVGGVVPPGQHGGPGQQSAQPQYFTPSQAGATSRSSASQSQSQSQSPESSQAGAQSQSAVNGAQPTGSSGSSAVPPYSAGPGYQGSMGRSAEAGSYQNGYQGDIAGSYGDSAGTSYQNGSSAGYQSASASNGRDGAGQTGSAQSGGDPLGAPRSDGHGRGGYNGVAPSGDAQSGGSQHGGGPQLGGSQLGGPHAGASQNGLQQNGVPQNGVPQNGVPQNGSGRSGMPQNAFPGDPGLNSLASVGYQQQNAYQRGPGQSGTDQPGQNGTASHNGVGYQAAGQNGAAQYGYPPGQSGQGATGGSQGTTPGGGSASYQGGGSGQSASSQSLAGQNGPGQAHLGQQGHPGQPPQGQPPQGQLPSGQPPQGQLPPGQSAQAGQAQNGLPQASYQFGHSGVVQSGGRGGAAPGGFQPGSAQPDPRSRDPYGTGMPPQPPGGSESAQPAAQGQYGYGGPDVGFDQSQRPGFGPDLGAAVQAQPQYQQPSHAAVPLPAVRVQQPVAIALPDAVKAAHAEGFSFGESVGRDAPGLWLEAVLARKPRMPSDLEARLLQGSVLPIDSLLHDEVRHSLRRGFWDALESARR